MIFKPNMIVVITSGRLAGKKGVVLKQLDESHLIVSGISRMPKESGEYLSPWEKRKNSKFLTFIKKINIRHLVATRYKADIGTVDIDLDSVVNDLQKKSEANKTMNKILEESHKNRKFKWLFTPLKF